MNEVLALAETLEKTVTSMDKQFKATTLVIEDLVKIGQGAAEVMDALGALQKMHQDKIIKLQDRVCTLEEKITGLGH